MFHGGREDRNSNYVKTADELIKALQASKGHLPTAEQFKVIETATNKLKEFMVSENKLFTAQEDRAAERDEHARTAKKGHF